MALSFPPLHDKTTGSFVVFLRGEFSSVMDASLRRCALPPIGMAAHAIVYARERQCKSRASMQLFRPSRVIDASTSDGRIRSEIPITVEGFVSKSRVRGKMNGGGQTLTIHSGDGSIRLNQV
jgi:hypothetical protein